MDLGRGLFKKVKDELQLVSKIERDTKMEGRRMTLVLQPDHKTATVKAAGSSPAVSSAPSASVVGVPGPGIVAAGSPPASAPAAPPQAQQ